MKTNDSKESINIRYQIDCDLEFKFLDLNSETRKRPYHSSQKNQISDKPILQSVRGILDFSFNELFLYQSKRQQKARGAIRGKQLKNELWGKYLYPANIIDFLILNPCLVPREYFGKDIWFLGSVFEENRVFGIRFFYSISKLNSYLKSNQLDLTESYLDYTIGDKEWPVECIVFSLLWRTTDVSGYNSDDFVAIRNI